MTNLIQPNQLLSRISFVTNVGDYLSFFAILVIVQQASDSVLIAAYSWPLKSLGMAVGGFLLPSFLTWLSPRSLLILSQCLSGFVILSTAAYASLTSSPTSSLVLTLFFIQNVTQRLFEGARETYSRSLGSPTEQRSLQAELLQGVYSAQVIGPIVAFLTIQYYSVILPLWLDGTSFIFAAILCLQLPKTPTSFPRQKYSIFGPLKYIFKSKALYQIFFLRAVGYWIPVGLWNYLIFSVITEHYHLTIQYSAWSYAAVGLGAVLSSTLLRYSPTGGARTTFERLQHGIWHFTDGQIACFALMLFATTAIAFIKIPALSIGLFFVFVGGIAGGLNAISTQSLRRKIVTPEQFPEVLGLEMLIGKFTDWITASICFGLISKNFITYEQGIWLTCMGLLLLSVLHLTPTLARASRG